MIAGRNLLEASVYNQNVWLVTTDLNHLQRRVRAGPGRLGDLVERLEEHVPQLGRPRVHDVDLRPPRQPRLRDDPARYGTTLVTTFSD